jgi:hypothetical protein
MTQPWKRLFIGLCLLLGATVGIAFYFWQRATQLPAWYQAETKASTAMVLTNSEQAEQQRQAVLNKVEAAVQQARGGDPVEVQLDQQEINDLMRAEWSRSAATLKVAPAVEGIKTEIRNGKVESGAVVNLKKLPSDQLSQREQAILEQVLTVFPALGDRPLYVGIEGTPRVENGQLVLDESTRIRLGELRFSLSDVAGRLGIAPEQLQERINLELQLGGVRVQDVELVGDRLVIRGAAQ